jgi:hypothetical protein
MTATDTLGRLENRHAYSAANAFKFDKWHSLFMPRQHDVTKLTRDELRDVFTLAWKWYVDLPSGQPVDVRLSRVIIGFVRSISNRIDTGSPHFSGTICRMAARHKSIRIFTRPSMPSTTTVSTGTSAHCPSHLSFRSRSIRRLALRVRTLL